MLTEDLKLDITLTTEGGVTPSSEQVGGVAHPSLIIEVCYYLLPSLSPDEPPPCGGGCMCGVSAEWSCGKYV